MEGQYADLEYRVLKAVKDEIKGSRDLTNEFINEVVAEIDAEIEIRKSKFTLII